MPDGRLMVEVIVKQFEEKFNRLFFAVLKEHNEKFNSENILKKLFPNSEVLIIDELTRGQADTIVKMIEKFQIEKSFLVKDSDSYFETVMQMLALYVYQHCLPRNPYIRVILTPLFVSPLNIVGFLRGKVLTNSGTFYHNNILI